MDEHRLSSLLKEFREHVPLRPERAPTIMEIAGYPHYENVCSNILAFFLDPHKPHGLGTLFLDALAEVGDIDDPEGLMDVEVEREVVTEARKRIDIRILSDSHAVLIENKIFASAINPWDEYAKHVEELSRAHSYKFVLSLTRTDAGKEQGFTNIMYQKLVHKIRGLMGNYVADADTRSLTFMLDFLNTLDYLQGDKIMNEGFLKFLTANHVNAEDFLKAYERVRRDLESKVKELYNMLGSERLRGRHFDPGRVGRSQIFERRKDPLKRAVLYKIMNCPAIPDAEITVVAVISPSGWQVTVALRNGNNPDNEELLAQQLEQLKELTNLKLEFVKEGDCFVLGQSELADFSYGANLEEGVFPVVRSVVRRLTVGIPVISPGVGPQ